MADDAPARGDFAKSQEFRSDGESGLAVVVENGDRRGSEQVHSDVQEPLFKRSEIDPAEDPVLPEDGPLQRGVPYKGPEIVPGGENGPLQRGVHQAGPIIIPDDEVEPLRKRLRPDGTLFFAGAGAESPDKAGPPVDGEPETRRDQPVGSVSQENTGQDDQVKDETGQDDQVTDETGQDDQVTDETGQDDQVTDETGQDDGSGNGVSGTGEADKEGSGGSGSGEGLPPVSAGEGKGNLRFNKEDWLKLMAAFNDLESGLIDHSATSKFGTIDDEFSVQPPNDRWLPSQDLNTAAKGLGMSVQQVNETLRDRTSKFVNALSWAIEVFENTDDLANYDLNEFVTEFPDLNSGGGKMSGGGEGSGGM